MKKCLSVLLALVMVLTMLAGCQGKSKPKDPETLARETVENYMDALMVFNFEKASTYTSDPDKMMEDAPYNNLEDATAAIMDAVPEEFATYEESITKFADAMFDVMKDKMDYEITAVTKDGDDYLVSVTLTTVDSDGANFMTDMMSDIDIEEMLMQMLEDGIINENMSEQQLMDILVPAIFDTMTEAVQNASVSTTTIEENFRIIKVDGKWVIDTSSL